MFENTDAFSGFSVSDVPAAKKFYSETLGLKVTEEHGMLTLHLNDGGRPTIVYPKGEDHVPATFTILNFRVQDIEAATDELSSRGVEFERYDWANQDERGVMREQGPPIAWFKDPAGNILSVVKDD